MRGDHLLQWNKWKNIKIKISVRYVGNSFSNCYTIRTSCVCMVTAMATTAPAEAAAAAATPLSNQYKMTKKGRKFVSTHKLYVRLGVVSTHTQSIRTHNTYIRVVKSYEQLLLNRLARVPSRKHSYKFRQNEYTSMLYYYLVPFWIANTNEWAIRTKCKVKWREEQRSIPVRSLWIWKEQYKKFNTRKCSLYVLCTCVIFFFDLLCVPHSQPLYTFDYRFAFICFDHLADSFVCVCVYIYVWMCVAFFSFGSSFEPFFRLLFLWCVCYMVRARHALTSSKL